VSTVRACGSAVAAVRQTVAGSLSIAFPAVVVPAELSAVTLQPVRGNGAGVVTATGTARGMMCAACGSRASAGPPASPCRTTAAPVKAHINRVAAARDHSLVFTFSPQQEVPAIDAGHSNIDGSGIGSGNPFRDIDGSHTDGSPGSP
jgi:hypothetical protein